MNIPKPEQIVRLKTPNAKWSNGLKVQVLTVQPNVAVRVRSLEHRVATCLVNEGDVLNFAWKDFNCDFTL